LKYRKYSNDKEVPQTAADLGYSTSPYKDYVTLMENDPSVLIDEKEKSNGNGPIQLKGILEKAGIDSDKLKVTFVQSLIQTDSWKTMVEDEDLQDLWNIFASDEGLDDFAFEDYNTLDAILELLENMDINPDKGIKEWVGTKVESALGGDTVAKVVANDELPQELNGLLGMALYETVKGSFYPSELAPTTDIVPVFPYLKLIRAINRGEITKLKFEEKYNSSFGLGAEFTVDGPGDLKTEYEDEAVVHTHYPSEDAAPNYAHTKPYDRRRASGYGFTTVNLDNVKGINDSSKKYNEL
jgi:hypothetical protein